jgi:sugar phosphate isomerase/epimerase
LTGTGLARLSLHQLVRNDFVLPLPPDRRRRGLMGEGCIDLRAFRRLVEEVGYAGPYDVEVVNEELTALPVDETVARVVASYQTSW